MGKQKGTKIDKRTERGRKGKTGWNANENRKNELKQKNINR